MTDPNAVIGRATDVVWRRVSNAIVADAGRGVVALEGAAHLVWELLDEPWSRAALVDDLAVVYGVSPDSISADVARVVDDALAAGLLTTAPVPAASVVRARVRARGEPILDNPAAAIAAWGLGPQVTQPDVDQTGWAGLLVAIERGRLTGLAHGAADAGDLVLTEEQRNTLDERHREAMLVAVRAERLLLTTIDELGRVGIDAVLHKGPSMAHVAYDDPTFRPFGDIDLLVRGEQLDAAFAALTELGHARRYSEPRPGFDRRFGKGAAFVTTEGLELDVHRTFAAGPFGITVDLDEVHAGTAQLPIAGRSIAVLGPTHQVVAVAMHAALGSRWPPLLNLRDVAQLLCTVGMDADDVVRVAMRWRVDAAVARAVRLTTETFRLDATPPLLAWAGAHRADTRARRALDAYTSPNRGYSRQAAAALPVIPGVRAKASYLRAMLLPDRTYEAHRAESRLARLRRLVRVTITDR